ncbi:CHASE2 domain-containing protein [Microvirga tunisiensis]|uniref:CHASE2 domain-containing protein n=1 Tax=Microvirga tunisiensis TaxID=2108360 RepID=UPI00128DE405|nr:adenylate/guanylate cyclase domain-containing protein [Microvirga tunisiensis]MPR12434.1 adenylate/guanylate cyclase domain-containing protein [Microvirga tunisiensis]
MVRCGVEAIGHGGTLLPKGGTASATGSAGCQPTWEGTRWAGGVAFDIIFAEPDRTSPSRYIDQLDLDDAGMGQQAYTQLRRLPDHDQVLAEAMATVPVVVGFATTERPNDRRPMRKAGFAFAGTVPTAILPPFQGSVTSLPLFDEAARGAASLSLGQDSASGIVRQIPLLLSDGRQIYPGLALEALRVAQGATSITVRSTGASGEQTSRPPALVELRVGQFTVPMTAEGELFLRFGRNRPERLVSARDVLDPDRHQSIRSRIEGHIVFIGTSAAGLHDRRVTPLAESVAGVTIHAQAVEQIIAQDFLRRPDWAKGLEILLTIGAGGFVALLLGRLSARYAAVVMIGAIAALFGGAWLTFSRLSLLVDPLYPSLGAVAVYLAVTSLLYLTTDREKRFVRQAFSRYLAPELLQKLEAAPDQLRLGGEIRPMTILFMDVRDFTPISERLSPEALIRFLNTLFSPLTEAIQECHGVVDKYIGDSIMAFWNAPVEVPNHAALACSAALKMQAIVDHLNATDAFGLRSGEAPELIVHIGIGLNTGEACVGNMGSENRFNYSVVGDAVNVAARIESSCKGAGAPILISEEAAREVEGFAVLEAGLVPLKGKSKPMKLFALVGDPAVARTSAFQELARDHHRLLAARCYIWSNQ